MIFKDSYNWILRIQKKSDTKASIYVMFRDCARFKRNVFVTWKECDVDEQDVDERKRCWVISESNLSQISARSLTSSNQYAVNSLAFTVNWLGLQPWYTRNNNHRHHEESQSSSEDDDENEALEAI